MNKIKYFLLSGVMLVSCVNAGKVVKDPFKKTDSQAVQQIYQMLVDMHDFFEYLDIKYMLTEETLLGAVRHKGLIPWEDGLNLCIFQSDEQKFIESLPVLRSMGYEIIGMQWGYKIYSADGESIEGYPWTFPGCDIFIIETDGQKVFYKWRINCEKTCSVEGNLSDVLPLRTYTFGPLVVFGPRNPVPYLKNFFGEQYISLARSNRYDHLKEKRMKKSYKELQEDDYAPARPSEPLTHKLLNETLLKWPFDFVGEYPEASK